MTDKLTRERLAELKREDWPRFRLAHIHTPTPTMARKLAEHPGCEEQVDRYLWWWVPGDCPGCGWGFFQWGIVHGAGFCSTCGWPGRLYHFVSLHEDEELRFDALLWAHPYTVSWRGR